MMQAKFVEISSMHIKAREQRNNITGGDATADADLESEVRSKLRPILQLVS